MNRTAAPLQNRNAAELHGRRRIAEHEQNCGTVAELQDRCRTALVTMIGPASDSCQQPQPKFLLTSYDVSDSVRVSGVVGRSDHHLVVVLRKALVFR